VSDGEVTPPYYYDLETSLAIQTMAITITNLRADFRSSESSDVSYIIVNCTFKCARDPENYDYAWNQAKAWSEEYRQVLTIDDPKGYEAWISNWDLNSRSKYPGYGKAWTHEDPTWQYIEKFDTFWFREWISDCGTTRDIIQELEYYRKHGELPWVYRAIDDCIILKHLRTLQSYWD
jgi:hypothetical protein